MSHNVRSERASRLPACFVFCESDIFCIRPNLLAVACVVRTAVDTGSHADCISVQLFLDCLQYMLIA